MSQPCGFLSDLLSCPNRQTYQTLIAPPHTCPQCNNGFADRETIEMVQGPWGCNQLIRSHVGGSHAIPGSWGNVPLAMNNWVGGLGMGASMSLGSGMGMGTGTGMCANMPRSMFQVDTFGHDHRLTGPYGSHPAIRSGYGFFDHGMIMDNGFANDNGYSYGHNGRRRRSHKSSSRYKYYHSSKPATNCTVM